MDKASSMWTPSLKKPINLQIKGMSRLVLPLILQIIVEGSFPEITPLKIIQINKLLLNILMLIKFKAVVITHKLALI